MNFNVILVCLAALYASSDAAVVVMPAVGPLGLVRPVVARVVPTMLGPVVVARPLVRAVGLGGVGLGLGLRAGVLGPLGKRSVDIPSNVTVCTISSQTMKLSCLGMSELSCEIEQNLNGLGSGQLVAKDLVLSKMVESKEHRLWNFLAENIANHRIIHEDHTFINPVDSKPITLAIYQSDRLSELGFRVKDKACFEKFMTIVRETNEDQIEYELFVSQTLPADMTTPEPVKFVANDEPKKVVDDSLINKKPLVGEEEIKKPLVGEEEIKKPVVSEEVTKVTESKVPTKVVA